MSQKKFLFAWIASSVCILIIMTIFGFLTQMVFPYDITSIGGMRSITDSLMLLFFLSPFVIGYAQTCLYAYTKKAFSGKEKDKAIKLGFLMYLIYVVPSEFIIFTSMTYPLGFHVDNIIGGFIYIMVASFVIVKIFK